MAHPIPAELPEVKFCKYCQKNRPIGDFDIQRGRNRERTQVWLQPRSKCKECRVKHTRHFQAKNRAAGRCHCGRERWKEKKQCLRCIEYRRRYSKSAAGRKAKHASGRKQRQQIKTQVFTYYGRFCACCGENTPEFLSIDHEGGWGKNHRDSAGRKLGGQNLYRWLVANNFPTGFRTLCLNCNGSLGYYGYCPHQKDKSQTGENALEL